MKKRLFTDIAAAVLIFTAFAFLFTGDAVHEFVGTAALILLIVHNVFNRRFWARPLAGPKRKLTQTLRVAGTFAVNAALGVAALFVLVSGMMISTVIFPFVPAAADGFVLREIHTTAAAWLFVLVAFHAGLHAQFLSGSLKTLFKKLQKPKAKAKNASAAGAGTRGKAGTAKSGGAGAKIALACEIAVALGLCAYGVFAFVRRLFPQKLIAEASFDPFSLDDTFPQFFADYFCLAALFFLAAGALKKFFPR